MTEKDFKNKMKQLDSVENISSKLFQKTGRIAYYGAMQGARDLKREYIKQIQDQQEM